MVPLPMIECGLIELHATVAGAIFRRAPPQMRAIEIERRS